LLDQSAGHDLLPAALKRGVDVIAAGVFNSGILANPVPGAFLDYAPASAQAISYAQGLRQLLEKFDVKLEQAAIQFPMTHSAVKAVVVGCRSELEVRSNISAFDATIPPSAWQAVSDFIESNGGLHG
jgi:D-threo-aldose 1-dehydrogenase